MGFQPFKVIVVTEAQLRKNISETACKQPQITEGSHVLVLSARTRVTQSEINEYIQRISAERNVSLESLSAFKKSLSSLLALNNDKYLQWSARQTYIALGIGLIAAATEQVDATPMEGINSEIIDDILGLDKLGLHSTVRLTLGYRNIDVDHLVNAKKVRKPKDMLFLMK